MKKIYLIRHGLPDFGIHKRMCIGRTDLPLCETGRRQAEAAAKQLEGKSFKLFSSPLLRAMQTAEPFLRPVTVLEDLQELYAGEWDGLDFDTIKKQYPALYEIRATDKTVSPPGAESNEAGLKRFLSAIHEAISQSPGDLAIVGHGGIMALFLKAVTGTWVKPGYGEIITLNYEDGIFTMLEDKDHA